MGYKLDIEKSHRKTKGGEVPRKIEKNKPFGRILRVFQDGKSEDHFVHVHATRGSKTRKLVLPPYLGAFA